MRATPLQIMVVAALSALAPAAYGSVRTHTVKPAPHAASSRASKRVVEDTRASTHKSARQTKAEAKLAAEKPDRHGKRAVAVKAEKVSAHGRHMKEEQAPPVRTKLVHGRRVVIEEAPAPKLIAKAQKPARLVAAPDPVNSAPAAPEPEPALDPIHVTHDRKQHYTAQPVATDAEQDDDAPRKATPADFLSVSPVPAPLPPAAAVKPVVTASVHIPAVKPVDKPATVIRTSPTAGVVVGAHVDLKPAPLPVIQIAPEPLVALYDKRGRLIVPPAMKGSHEVLVHQNVMADSDGLERIQDDEDLSRMRVSKMLVALPDTDGLQTDERLPVNRRYCRPWTAAFLTALARAHYARFHTPLQVNSAVRTVEFQQRLIRTNGNAAPAEGETASPHLTGQAVDLAKHGLSMTEIAWLRGYLLPLVQSGKVDVEEEFQQACFHISVYKKYIPQQAPRRSIAEAKHVAGSTLAIAIP